MEATQKTPIEMLVSGEIKNLDQLFIATDSNFTNLYERLGISTYKLTKVKNNPKEECDFDLLRDISRITGVKATILMETLGLGIKVVTKWEFDNIKLEEATQ